MEENCVRADASHTYEPGPNDYVVNSKHLTVIVGVEPDDIRLSQPSQLEVNENGNMKRNTFACVKCHDLKQKCRPSDVGDIYRNPCVRCLRSRDPCIFDLAKRKRKRVRRSRHENSVGNNKYQKRKIVGTLNHRVVAITTKSLEYLWLYLISSRHLYRLLKILSQSETKTGLLLIQISIQKQVSHWVSHSHQMT